MPDPVHPDDHAIVVGINHYPRMPDTLQSLQGARNDARFFHDWLLEPEGGGLASQNVRLITLPDEEPKPEPTINQIEDAALALLQRAKTNHGRAGRRLYLFFSGHGVTPGSMSDECALLMANVTRETLYRHLPGQETALRFRLSDIFPEVVLFMDCCRVTNLPAPQPRMLPDFGDGLPGAQDNPYLFGLATEWSLTAGERVLPLPRGAGEACQGLFTHALLEGLRLAASDDGVVHSADLTGYVTQRVMDLSGGEQEPKFEGEGEGLTFGNALPPARVTVRIRLKATASALEVVNGDLEDVPLPAGVDLSSGQVELPLAPGKYRFTVPGTDRKVIHNVVGRLVHLEL